MEELVGRFWHRLIARASRRGYPDGAVELDTIRGAAGVLLRALAGDGGLRVEAAVGLPNGARRSWMERIGGTGGRVALAWRDGDTLHLPPRIEVFPAPELNRELYLWLAALAAAEGGGARPGEPWMVRSQRLTRALLERFPGLVSRYRRLAGAQLALRPNPATLPSDEAALERAIQTALRHPEADLTPVEARRPPQPVYLWLHPVPPSLPAAGPAEGVDPTEPEEGGDARRAGEARRQRGERTEMPKGQEGLVALRMENIFSWAEYLRVDRTTDEDGDADPGAVVDDMDVIAVARDNRPVARRLRLDLDLPAAAYDDLPVGGPITLPEWDYRRQTLLPDQCCLQPMTPRNAVPADLPPRLAALARRLRAQFRALAQSRQWQRGQQDGSDLDLDAYLRFAAERRQGLVPGEPGLYRDLRAGRRDLACLLLADLSLSTDAAVNDEMRVIDVIRDSLFLFSEALAAAGDRFALCGFSSKRREHVRFHTLKAFDEAYDAAVRGRIQATRPGYYTRMGAAVRHATALLAREPAGRRLLLLLTDGKPNDLDRYEGRFGLEDTRKALLEARKAGLDTFCVTVDEKARDYLPHLFGPAGYVVVRRPGELPRHLPALYARLTA